MSETSNGLNLDNPEIVSWCARSLDAEPVEVLFRTVHLSTVLGCRLTDGGEVVLKLRPHEERLYECFRVQQHLWSKGFPCPQPLAGPSIVTGMLTTAEALVRSGEERRRGLNDVTRYADALALQIRLCEDYDVQATLDPAPPWLGWKHDGPGVWPLPDDLDVDLNALPGPGWLDDVARRVASLLLNADLPLVVGHGDWHPGNLRWLNDGLHAVFDWDSVAHLPEAALAGGAAVLYPGDARAAASFEESAAFFAAYAEARGRGWSFDESRVFWAAGLWNLAFDAKKQAQDGLGRSLESLQQTMGQRLRRAGL